MHLKRALSLLTMLLITIHVWAEDLVLLQTGFALQLQSSAGPLEKEGAAPPPANSRDFESSSSQYADCTKAVCPDLNFEGGNTVMYVNFWWKPESVGAQQILMGISRNTNADYQWDIRMLDTGVMEFVKAYGASSYATVDATTHGALSAGTEYFIEVYNDGTNMGIAVNRGSDNTTADTNTFRSSTTEFALGRRPGAVPDGYADGAVQSITVIRGSVPGTSDRNAFYNAGTGVWDATKPSLTYTAFYECSESSGANFTDSVSGYTLTQVNTVGTAAALVG